MQLEQRVILITGASSGLGLATARKLIKAGAKVVLADINVEAGQARAAELGENAFFVAVDITQDADASRAIAQTLEHFGALHGLVNCAGVAPAEKLLGRHGVHGLESFRKVVDVNLIGTFNMLRLAAEAIARSEPQADGERGVLINTASAAAFDGQIGQAAYAASKSAVVGLTLPLARELARSGIRVMCIAPGIFETPMMAGMPQEVRDGLAATVPFPPRLGKPDEYAALVLHIIENSMLNGEVIRLDGALRMAAR